jgi:hypothetical protein
MATRAVIDTDGIRKLVRDFGKMDKTLRAALVKSLRDVGDKARDNIRSSTSPPYRTGTLRRSTKTSVRGGSIALYSLLPQAPVLHWGGTIKPRGVPIRFKRTEYIRKEVLRESDHIEGELAGVLEATATRFEFV